jgi:hypothetical protein
MAEPEHVKAMQLEITKLESHCTWDEVNISDTKSKILPSTWVLHHKCTPDGKICTYEACYCCQADPEEGTFETFALVVAWIPLHLFFVLTITLG